MSSSDNQRNGRRNEIALLGTNLERLAKDLFRSFGYLVEMIKMKEKQDDPSEILINKVDNMFIGLEK